MVGVLVTGAELAIHIGPADAFAPCVDSRRGGRFGSFERARINTVRDAVILPEQVAVTIIGDHDRGPRPLLVRRGRRSGA